MRKLIFLFLGFYLLTLIQASFLIHFGLKMGFIPILILIALINFFESPPKKLGIYSALFGGFFLDIFSEKIFGFWILISLAISLFIKFIFKKYIHFKFSLIQPWQKY